MTAATVIPRLWGEGFNHDRESAYAMLRQAGPVALAEIAEGVTAYIVTTHDAAMEMATLTHGDGVERDTGRWRRLPDLPANADVLGILAPRPSLLFRHGPDHDRLRGIVNRAISRVRPARFDEITRRVTRELLDARSDRGVMDVVELATAVPLEVFADLLGCDRDTSAAISHVCAQIINAGPEAAEAAETFGGILAGIVVDRAQRPRNDLASWMLLDPARPSVPEVIGCLYSFIGAGHVTTATWITNTLVAVATTDTGMNVLGGAISVKTALQQSLRTHSPMDVFEFYVAERPAVIADCEIPAGELVMLWHHGANLDAAEARQRSYSRAHTSWGVGAHTCPVPAHATAMAAAAVETVLNRLDDFVVTEVGPLRPGLFHRTPSHVNAVFTPIPSGGNRA